MKKLIAVLLLSLASTSVFAKGGFVTQVVPAVCTLPNGTVDTNIKSFGTVTKSRGLFFVMMSTTGNNAGGHWNIKSSTNGVLRTLYDEFFGSGWSVVGEQISQLFPGVYTTSMIANKVNGNLESCSFKVTFTI